MQTPTKQPDLKIWEEQVFSGHPDKLADTIAMAVHGYIMRTTKGKALTAIECLVSRNKIFIAGEVYGFAFDEEQKTIITNRLINFLKKYNYHLQPDFFEYDINNQSPYIHEKVAPSALPDYASLDHLCGDMAVCMGYSMDFSIPDYVKKIARRLEKLIWNNTDMQIKSTHLFNKAHRDGKIVCCFQKDKNKEYKIVLSDIYINVEHNKPTELPEVRQTIKEFIEMIMPEAFKTVNIEVNSTGAFCKGGLFADTGLTGRKLAHDSYGLNKIISSGASAGKDFTKPDRLGNTLAKYLAQKTHKEFQNEGINLVYLVLFFKMGSNLINDFFVDTSPKLPIEKKQNVIKFVQDSLLYFVRQGGFSFFANDLNGEKRKLNKLYDISMSLINDVDPWELLV